MGPTKSPEQYEHEQAVKDLATAEERVEQAERVLEKAKRALSNAKADRDYARHTELVKRQRTMGW